MASLRLNVFERLLVDFKQTLSPDEVNTFAATTLPQLQASIIVIQKQQKSSRTMQNLNRIQGFLEAI
jgi:hypothetical protein